MLCGHVGGDVDAEVEVDDGFGVTLLSMARAAMAVALSYPTVPRLRVRSMTVQTLRGTLLRLSQQKAVERFACAKNMLVFQ